MEQTLRQAARDAADDAAPFVTENTVQTHVRHTFHKLGVRSGTELAAWFLSTSASTASREVFPRVQNPY